MFSDVIIYFNDSKLFICQIGGSQRAGLPPSERPSDPHSRGTRQPRMERFCCQTIIEICLALVDWSCPQPRYDAVGFGC